MANCFLDVWQELLGLVQHAQRDPDVAGLESLDALLGRLKSLPPQPQSVWEKVVQDMQVGTCTYTRSVACWCCCCCCRCTVQPRRLVGWFQLTVYHLTHVHTQKTIDSACSRRAASS